MGAFKNLAIAQRNDEVVAHHAWKFVENVARSMRERIDRNELLAEFATAYARSCKSVDEAVDAIEKPHHYAREIAAFLCGYDIADDETIAEIGYWECEDCDRVANRMTYDLDNEKSCYGRK